jgi:hypothetical protein
MVVDILDIGVELDVVEVELAELLMQIVQYILDVLLMEQLEVVVI